MARTEFEAIGTRWTIDIYDDLAVGSADRLFSMARDRIERFEEDYSRFRAGSWLTRAGGEPGTHRMPEDAEPLFTAYRDLYRLTGGAFTPLIGQVMEDAGYDPSYSLKPKTLRLPPSWEQALDYRFPELKVKTPVRLDVGAAGKGRIIDLVGGLLEAEGVRSYCVDAGGDLRHRDPSGRSIAVGLEDPSDLKAVIGTVALANRCLCGSAGSRRKWDRFHHIIDPRTLASPSEVTAVWTLTPTAMIGDAVATCLFFVPPEKLLGAYAFEYLIMYANRSVRKSPGFPAELFGPVDRSPDRR